jgi:hypothetical protein
MSKERTEHPFQFCTQWSLVELTGLRARDLRELVTHLQNVPGSAIYYHTHHFLKQHHFLSPEPPNDFAYWVTSALNEDRLGERLASVDTIRYSTLRALRERIIAIVQDHLSHEASLRQTSPGEEFHFMKSKSFVVQTPYQASTLDEFLAAIQKISIHSLYHHIFEARLRLERGKNDFSHWLESELEEKDLAQAISRLDPYTQTLEGLRAQMVRLVERQKSKHAAEGIHAA